MPSWNLQSGQERQNNKQFVSCFGDKCFGEKYNRVKVDREYQGKGGGRLLFYIRWVREVSEKSHLNQDLKKAKERVRTMFTSEGRVFLV